MKAVNNTEFVQISTRLRATLGTLSHADRIQKAVDAATSAGALATAFRSVMMQDVNVPESAGLDELCDAYMSYAVETVRACSPEKGLYDSLLYKYDAANLKLALKSSLRAMEPPALFPYGTLDRRTVLRAAQERDFSALPAGLRRGCEEAVASYAESSDAINVDLAIDRGCFEDISAAAERSGIPLLCELASLDADSANVTAFARIAQLSLPPEAKRELFGRAFVVGGRIPEAQFPRTEITLSALADALGGTYIGADIREAAEDDDPVPSLEAALRKRRGAVCDRVKFIPFGGEVPAAYIVEREAEVRAFALCAAYLRRGASQSEIRAAAGNL